MACCTAHRMPTSAGRKRVQIAGRGYTHRDTDQELPPLPPGASLDASAQERYAEFSRKRAGTGLGQYSKIDEALLADPFTEPEPRAPQTRDVEVLIIGGGFSALLNISRLREAGFSDIVVCEKGGDVGGTWLVSQHVSSNSSTPDLPLNTGTGTDTPASPATSSRTRTCRCWRRWATCRA